MKVNDIIRINMTKHVDGVTQGSDTEFYVRNTCNWKNDVSYAQIVSLNDQTVTIQNVPFKKSGYQKQTVSFSTELLKHWLVYQATDKNDKVIEIGQKIVISSKDGELTEGIVDSFGDFSHRGCGWIERVVNVKVTDTPRYDWKTTKKMRQSFEPHTRLIIS